MPVWLVLFNEEENEMAIERLCPVHQTLDCNCVAACEQRVRINAEVPLFPHAHARGEAQAVADRERERRVPRVHEETVIKNENDIERAIEMVVAMTRNLLSLPESMEVDVHVKPANRMYHVTVDVAGFILRKSNARLATALEELLGDLSTRVHQRMQEAAALLGR